MIGLKADMAKRELRKLIRGYFDDASIPITVGCLAIEGILAELRDEALEAAAQQILNLQKENKKLKEGKSNDKPESTRDLEENRGDDGSNDRAHEG